MKTSDALAILGLSGEVTKADIDAAWRAMAAKYHPDRNPAGAEMMKLINAARDALKDFEGESADAGESQADYGDALNAALNAIINLDGLEIEICGAWLWVGGETKRHKEALKAAGFRWASRKKKWNFRPDNWKSLSRGNVSMDDIRSRYGSKKPYRGGWTAADNRRLAADDMDAMNNRCL